MKNNTYTSEMHRLSNASHIMNLCLRAMQQRFRGTLNTMAYNPDCVHEVFALMPGWYIYFHKEVFKSNFMDIIKLVKRHQDASAQVRALQHKSRADRK